MGDDIEETTTPSSIESHGKGPTSSFSLVDDAAMRRAAWFGKKSDDAFTLSYCAPFYYEKRILEHYFTLPCDYQLLSVIMHAILLLRLYSFLPFFAQTFVPIHECSTAASIGMIDQSGY